MREREVYIRGSLISIVLHVPLLWLGEREVRGGGGASKREIESRREN